MTNENKIMKTQHDENAENLKAIWMRHIWQWSKLIRSEKLRWNKNGYTSWHQKLMGNSVFKKSSVCQSQVWTTIQRLQNAVHYLCVSSHGVLSVGNV